MRFRSLPYRYPVSLIFLQLAGGCQSPWYAAEPVADALIPPTNPWVCETSRSALADKVGQPCDIQFFGDQAEYMGDADGYHYVHVRDNFAFWGWLGECVYKVPASQWPMAHPMALTYDASKWQDVTWMSCDAPAGVKQNAFLVLTPSFPEGAPETQPATLPATTDFRNQPATPPATSEAALPATESTAATVPSSAPAPEAAPTQTTSSATLPAPTTQP